MDYFYLDLSSILGKKIFKGILSFSNRSWRVCVCICVCTCMSMDACMGSNLEEVVNLWNHTISLLLLRVIPFCPFHVDTSSHGLSSFSLYSATCIFLLSTMLSMTFSLAFPMSASLLQNARSRQSMLAFPGNPECKALFSKQGQSCWQGNSILEKEAFWKAIW